MKHFRTKNLHVNCCWNWALKAKLRAFQRIFDLLIDFKEFFSNTSLTRRKVRGHSNNIWHVLKTYLTPSWDIWHILILNISKFLRLLNFELIYEYKEVWCLNSLSSMTFKNEKKSLKSKNLEKRKVHLTLCRPPSLERRALFEWTLITFDLKAK